MDSKFIEMAKSALSPEQKEEYDKIGQYMYQEDKYKVQHSGQSIRAPDKGELIAYACAALKSGLDPMELTPPEVESLVYTYGEKWYERFDFQENEVPKPGVNLTLPQLPQLPTIPRKLRRRLERSNKNKK